jgi:hypothetical protein
LGDDDSGHSFEEEGSGVMKTVDPEGVQTPDPEQQEELPPTTDPEALEPPEEKDADVVGDAEKDLAGRLGAIGPGRSG